MSKTNQHIYNANEGSTIISYNRFSVFSVFFNHHTFTRPYHTILSLSLLIGQQKSLTCTFISYTYEEKKIRLHYMHQALNLWHGSQRKWIHVHNKMMNYKQFEVKMLCAEINKIELRLSWEKFLGFIANKLNKSEID